MTPQLRLHQNISQQQRLTQKMSQQQIMSVNLLAMSAIDLREDIYEQVAKNPALEILQDDTEEGTKDLSHRYPNDNLKLARTTNKGELASDNFLKALESNPDERETLSDHLEHQFLSMNHTSTEESLGLALIGNLDKNGFHILSPQSFLKTKNLNASESTLLKIINQIQQLDPIGTCVKNVEESLFVQARYKEYSPDCALFLLNGHFDFLNPPQPVKILKKINDYIKQTQKLSFIPEQEQKFIESYKKNPYTLQDVEKALSFIKTLDPFPARNFGTQQTHFIKADIIVEQIQIDDDNDEQDLVLASTNSAFKIKITNDNIPRLSISDDFRTLACQELKKSSGDEKTENQNAQIKFAKESIQNAKVYIDSIQYRQSTMAKAATEIVKNQIDFFKNGPRYLAPLRQKDIANAIGVHETTISRMSNSKYLQCKWGLFELGYFFTNAVGIQNHSNLLSKLEDAPASSKEAVKYEISQILQEHKDDKKPLSDQKISDLLAQKNIKIARRTVAKYRNELNVSSSYERQ